MSSFKWPPSGGGGGGESVYSNEWSGDLTLINVDGSETVGAYISRIDNTVFLCINSIGIPSVAKAAESGAIAVTGLPAWAAPPVTTNRRFHVPGITEGHIESDGANAIQVRLANASGTTVIFMLPLDTSFVPRDWNDTDSVVIPNINLVYEGIEL